MDYLKPKSPITKGQIKALFMDVEQVKTAKAKIDGVVLSNLLKLCYFCGLRKGELIGLTIRNVSHKRIVKDTITIDGHEVVLALHAKKLLERHIKYLKENGYRLYSSRPLFPTRGNEPYKEKTLQNHLEKIFNDMPDKINLEHIRKAAVCHFYDNLKRAGERPQACLEKTSDFARILLRSTKDLLLDQIQPTGVKPYPVGVYLKEIEDLKHSLLNSKDPKDRGDRDAICRKIENDPSLSVAEKNDLKKSLNKSVEYAIDQRQVKSEPPPKNFNKALREAISNIQPSDPKFDEN